MVQESELGLLEHSCVFWEKKMVNAMSNLSKSEKNDKIDLFVENGDILFG